jgi:uncharacterized damage-inducible protein DinB
VTSGGANVGKSTAPAETSIHATALRSECAGARIEVLYNSAMSSAAVAAIAPAEDEYAPHYQTYIRLVPEGDIVSILARQTSQTVGLYAQIPEESAGYRYGVGKWTVRQTLGHVIDSERVFTYRALRISRSDQTPLASFDQDLFVDNGPSEAATLAQLREEFEAVRHATLCLFRGLRDADWSRAGVASSARITVRALARIVAGHELHHQRILEERYLKGIVAQGQ